MCEEVWNIWLILISDLTHQASLPPTAWVQQGVRAGLNCSCAKFPGGFSPSPQLLGISVVSPAGCVRGRLER